MTQVTSGAYISGVPPGDLGGEPYNRKNVRLARVTSLNGQSYRNHCRLYIEILIPLIFVVLKGGGSIKVGKLRREMQGSYSGLSTCN